MATAKAKTTGFVFTFDGRVTAKGQIVLARGKAGRTVLYHPAEDAPGVEGLTPSQLAACKAGDREKMAEALDGVAVEVTLRAIQPKASK